MSGNQSYGGGQGQGGTFGRSQGFNPQSLGGLPGMNNAMQRFAPQQSMFGAGGGLTPMKGTQSSPMDPNAYGGGPFVPPQMGGGQMPTNAMPQGYSAPTVMQDPMTMGQQPPQSQRYGVPATPAPPMPMLGQAPKTPEQLAAHMAQRNAITNGYVDPGQKPTPFQLQNHMNANAAYSTGYGGPGSVPMPPWLLPR